MIQITGRMDKCLKEYPGRSSKEAANKKEKIYVHI